MQRIYAIKRIFSGNLEDFFRNNDVNLRSKRVGVKKGVEFGCDS